MARWQITLAALGLALGCGSLPPSDLVTLQHGQTAPLPPDITGPTPGIGDEPPIIKLPGQTVSVTPTTSTTGTAPTTSTTGTLPGGPGTVSTPPGETTTGGGELPPLPPTPKKEEVLLTVPKNLLKYARIYQDAIFRDKTPEEAYQAAIQAAAAEGVNFEAGLQAANVDLQDQLKKSREPDTKLRFVVGR